MRKLFLCSARQRTARRLQTLRANHSRLAPLSCLSTASHLRVRRCTYYESEYARNAGKKMILLRMIPWGAQFEHLQGRIIFGMNELVLTWVEETEMPETLCDDIVAALEGETAAANEPAAEAVSMTESRMVRTTTREEHLNATVQQLAAELAALKQAMA